jgi:hypothetical protein
MGRSTFDGPIQAGDQRFAPQRNIGSVDLVQTAFLDFSVTTPNTANYGGTSGVFVNSNGIPNSIATIYTPQGGVFSNSGATTATAPTADTSGTIYRGVQFWLPWASNINDVIVDVGVLPTDGTVTANSIQPYISNNFATSTGLYGTMAAITSATRGTATFVGAQLVRANATLQDVQNLQTGTQAGWFTQVVVTLKITNTSLVAPTSGQIEVTIRYNQLDMNIGTSTVYPYGNFD